MSGDRVSRITVRLADAGLDLVHAFDAHAVAADPSSLLAGWARLANGPRLGLLVGNTRALWPHFVAARDALPEKDPLDHYVERAIESAIIDDVATASSTATDAANLLSANAPAASSPVATVSRTLYAHRSYDGAFLPFQHLAVAVGFGALTDGKLVVHPIYGPWFALRAVILVDGEPPVRAPIAKPCACTGTCATALDAALLDGGNWRAWLAVRDACALRAWRYSDEQIQFHYGAAWPDARR